MGPRVTQAVWRRPPDWLAVGTATAVGTVLALSGEETVRAILIGLGTGGLLYAITWVWAFCTPWRFDFPDVLVIPLGHPLVYRGDGWHVLVVPVSVVRGRVGRPRLQAKIRVFSAYETGQEAYFVPRREPCKAFETDRPGTPFMGLPLDVKRSMAGYFAFDYESGSLPDNWETFLDSGHLLVEITLREMKTEALGPTLPLPPPLPLGVK